MKPKNEYPFFIPFLRNIFNLTLLGLGLIVLGQIHPFFAFFYGGYCLLAAFFLMPKLRCTRCCYHNLRCSTGFGLISGLLYAKDHQHSFTDGIWHNVFLLPIGLIPLSGALWRVLIWRDTQSLWLGLAVVMILAGLLTEHANLGCRACQELPGCPARFVVNPLSSKSANQK